MSQGEAVFVARDFTPSKCFGLVAEHFPEAVVLVGNGDDISETDATIEHAAQNARVLVIGMSHSPEAARAELLAGEAADRGTKIALFADSFFCSARNWFAPLRGRVNLVMTCTRSEAAHARAVFPKAKVVACGNPNWEANHFRATAACSRWWTIRKELGVYPGELLAFVPLRKECPINMEHLAETVSASTELPDKLHEKMQFRATAHPGEPDREVRLETYQRLTRGLDQFQIVTTSTSEMLAACNLVINAASGAGTEALFMRLPVIELLSEAVLDELKRLQGGVRKWQPCEDGAALAVTNALGMARAIRELLEPQSAAASAMLERQQECYPAPTRPRAAVDSIVAEIQALLNS